MGAGATPTSSPGSSTPPIRAAVINLSLGGSVAVQPPRRCRRLRRASSGGVGCCRQHPAWRGVVFGQLSGGVTLLGGRRFDQLEPHVLVVHHPGDLRRSGSAGNQHRLHRTVESDLRLRSASGTSMATPYAGAAVSLVKGRPRRSAAQVRRRSRSTAVDVADPGNDTCSGSGLIDPWRRRRRSFTPGDHQPSRPRRRARRTATRRCARSRDGAALVRRSARRDADGHPARRCRDRDHRCGPAWLHRPDVTAPDDLQL